MKLAKQSEVLSRTNKYRRSKHIFSSIDVDKASLGLIHGVDHGNN
ncbi:hypothetical protein [Lentibacillus daqui]|nr:hypothetical protein [Lentibacillus daqui]